MAAAPPTTANTAAAPNAAAAAATAPTPPSWQMPAQGGKPANRAAGTTGVTSLASLYVVPQQTGTTDAGGVPRVSARPGFSSAAARAQQQAQAGAQPAIPPTVTYPASSLLAGSAQQQQAAAGGPVPAPARSPLPPAPTLPSQPGASKFAVASHVPFTPAAATPQPMGSLTTSSPSLLAAFASGGGTPSGGGGLAQPAGARDPVLGRGVASGVNGSAAAAGASLFSVPSAGSGLTSPLPASFVAVGGVGHALQRQAAQAKLEQAQQQKVALDVGQPLNALTCSPDRTHLAVGGKEVKVISYASGRPFKVEQSTNSKTPTALSDIQWHPLEAFASWLVAAPTNGKILLYNLLSKEALRRPERTLDDHERTVNRIVWHPTQGEILFSGSQDGTVKMFDMRNPGSKAVQAFADAHSVRDVQVNPFNSNVFAASYENGSIQIWDVRKGAYFHTINAHQGLILTLDWHPEDKDILASGGVDRAIKVWNVNSSTIHTISGGGGGGGGIHSASAANFASSASSSLSSSAGGSGGSSSATNQTEPLHTIQTIASVGRVRWRPSPRYPFQLASAANLMDCKIHIWNVHKPFVPLVSLLGHKDVVTGFFFADAASYSGIGGSSAFDSAAQLASEIISCSKDSTIQKNFLFIDHALHPNYHLTSYPAEQLRTSGIAWNIRGDIATVNDAIDRRNNIMQPDPVLPGPFNFLAHHPVLLSGATISGTSTPHSALRTTAPGSIQSAVLASMMHARAPLLANVQQEGMRNGFIRIFNGATAAGEVQHQPVAAATPVPMLLSPEDMSSYNEGVMDVTNMFVYFARQLRFTADEFMAAPAFAATPASPPPTFVTLCQHNSAVARSAGALELSQIWLILAQMLGPGVRKVEVASTGPPPLPMDDGLPATSAASKKAADAAQQAATLAAAGRSHTTTYVHPQPFNPSTMRIHRSNGPSSLQLSVADSPPAVAASPSAHAHTASLHAFSDQFLQIQLVNEPVSTGTLNDAATADDAMADAFSALDPISVAALPVSRVSVSTSAAPDASPSRASPSAHARPALGIQLIAGSGAPVPDPTQTISALNRSTVLLDCLPTIHKSHCYSLQQPQQTDDIASRALAAVMQQPSSVPPVTLPNPYNSSLSLLSSPRLHARLLTSFLESTIERGDVQTCVCVVSLLKEFHPACLAEMERLEKDALADQMAAAAPSALPSHTSPAFLSMGSSRASAALSSSLPAAGHSVVDRFKQWYFSYIDLLQRCELYSCASEIIQLCGDSDLKKMNQKSTTISLTCPVCKHASQTVGVGCTSKACMKTRMTNCAICQLTVFGVHVWCQGCGHGGHMDHMQDWFSKNSVCPSGCLHRCEESLTTINPGNSHAHEQQFH